MTREQIVAMPLERIDGEKVGAARMPCESAIGDGSSIAAPYIRRNALRLLLRVLTASFPRLPK